MIKISTDAHAKCRTNTGKDERKIGMQEKGMKTGMEKGEAQ